MYKVTSGRCLASCNLIYDATTSLVRKMHLRNVTVSAISRVSGVSRVTFYKYFDSPEDVLLWKLDTDMNECFKGAPSFSQENISAFADHFFRYWTNHSEILDMLLGEGLYGQFVSSVYHYLKSSIMPALESSGISEPTIPYLLRIYPAILTTILFTWVLKGKKESVEKLSSTSLHNCNYPFYSREVADGASLE